MLIRGTGFHLSIIDQRSVGRPWENKVAVSAVASEAQPQLSQNVTSTS